MNLQQCDAMAKVVLVDLCSAQEVVIEQGKQIRISSVQKCTSLVEETLQLSNDQYGDETKQMKMPLSD